MNTLLGDDASDDQKAIAGLRPQIAQPDGNPVVASLRVGIQGNSTSQFVVLLTRFAKSDRAFANLFIANVINKDPATSKAWQAQLKKFPAEAKALDAALGKTSAGSDGGGILDFLNRKVVGPVPVWGIGLGGLAALYLVMRKR